ncbi:MAG: hypothetical protein H7Z75_14935 [Ferruginibacter sp.]|nr:hypothetical protein [Cytophagales bacterium]
MNRLVFLATVIVAGQLTGCSFLRLEAPDPPFNQGVLILQSNSLSYLDTATQRVINNVFLLQNREPLGADAHSLRLHSGRGYAVLSRENRLRVFDARSLGGIGFIGGLENCRFLAGVDAAKAYVTCWGNAGKASVAVVDLASRQVTRQIPVAGQPERVLVDEQGAYAYVAHAAGNTLTVLDQQTDAVAAVLPVADHPAGLVLDRNRNLWVLCSGRPADGDDPGTAGQLIRFSPSDLREQIRLNIKPVANARPANLAINRAGNRLYYTQGKNLYRLPITATPDSIPTNILVKEMGWMDIDPASDVLYGSPVGDRPYTYRYPLAAARLDSFPVVSRPIAVAFHPEQ